MKHSRSLGLTMAGVATSCGVKLVHVAANRRIEVPSRTAASRCQVFREPSAGDEAKKSGRNATTFLRRDVVISTAALFSAALLLQEPAAAAILEADDDLELLEKAKGDRQKRIEKRGALSSLKNETASLQVAVYKLSKAGQAIENEDFATATSVLGTALDADWVAKTKSALDKVSVNSQEQGEAEAFTKSLSSLQSAVSRKDADSAKSAFVASASALEKWTSLTGLTEQIKGL